MIQHLDSLALLAALVKAEHRGKSQRKPQMTFTINQLCRKAYAVEKQKKDILFDMDNASLARSQRTCNNEIIIQDGYIIIPNVHAQHLTQVLKANKPSQAIEKMILTDNEQ